MNQDILIRNSTFHIGKADNSKFNIQHSKLPTAIIHRHSNTSEVVACFYGSAIERSFDKQGNETEMVAMKTGSDTSGIIMNKWLINQIDIKCWH